MFVTQVFAISRRMAPEVLTFKLAL